MFVCAARALMRAARCRREVSHERRGGSEERMAAMRSAEPVAARLHSRRGHFRDEALLAAADRPLGDRRGNPKGLPSGVAEAPRSYITMIYGLYLSASGILANSYNVDVLANNLANSESVGFKRDMTLFRQRLTQAQLERKAGDWSDPLLEKIGGGLAVNPTVVDTQQGELESDRQCAGPGNRRERVLCRQGCQRHPPHPRRSFHGERQRGTGHEQLAGEQSPGQSAAADRSLRRGADVRSELTAASRRTASR